MRKFDDFGQKIGQFSLFKTTVTIMLIIIEARKKDKHMSQIQDGGRGSESRPNVPILYVPI